VTIREIWNRVAKGKYTLALEAEVARLRAENRALLNSILGIAGIPPVVVSAPDVGGEGVRGKQSQEACGAISAPSDGAGAVRRKSRPSIPSAKRRMAGVPPTVRHRSWHQVNRMLEFDAIRNGEKTSGETQPAAGQS
jgi:hypothetical protein